MRDHAADLVPRKSAMLSTTVQCFVWTGGDCSVTSSRRKKDHIFSEQEGRAYKCVSPDISFHVRVALAPLTPKKVST
jgi:hypothetical protein